MKVTLEEFMKHLNTLPKRDQFRVMRYYGVVVTRGMLNTRSVPIAKWISEMSYWICSNLNDLIFEDAREVWRDVADGLPIGIRTKFEMFFEQNSPGGPYRTGAE